MINPFFQAFQLAIAAGVIMFHGQLVRHLTSGQLPVTALMSSDNGKAQVPKITTLKSGSSIFVWFFTLWHFNLTKL